MPAIRPTAVAGSFYSADAAALRAEIDDLLGAKLIGVLDAAHAQEHSLEVHLPFLQVALDEFALVPIVAGDASPEAVVALLDAVWAGPETLIVVSTDLSHYLDIALVRRQTARPPPQLSASTRVVSGRRALAAGFRCAGCSPPQNAAA